MGKYSNFQKFPENPSIDYLCVVVSIAYNDFL